MRSIVAFALCCSILSGCGASSMSTSSSAPPRPSASAKDATPDARKVSKAKAAPDFTLRTLDGGTFTLSEHRGELPVVLNFWAPW